MDEAVQAGDKTVRVQCYVKFNVIALWHHEVHGMHLRASAYEFMSLPNMQREMYYTVQT